MAPRSKFIVIEGTDGSGKTAQFERLILALPEGTKLGTLDFPRYGEPSSYFVQKYLTGKYGSDIGPYTASMFFAMDRFDTRLKMLQWIEDGRVLISNRYVASNMAHQGAKIDSKADRETFYKWLFNLEYEVLALPKPDVSIILHVPAEIAYDLIVKKRGREFLLKGGARDIHEADLAHQKRAEEVYLEIAKTFPDDFIVVECAPKGKLLSIEEVHAKVWAAAKKVLEK